MQETNTRKLKKMGRRRFISALTALGLSAQTVQGLEQDKLPDLTDDLGDQVPHAKVIKLANPERWDSPPFPDHAPEREIEYTTISRDRYNEREAAYDAASRVKNRIDDFPVNTKNINTSVKATTQGGIEQFTVSVDIIEDGTKKSPAVRAEEKKKEIDKRLPNTVYGQPESSDQDNPSEITADEVDEITKGAVEEVPVESIISVESDDDCECTDSDITHYERQYRRGATGHSFDITPQGCGATIQRGTAYGADPKSPEDWSNCTLGLPVYDPDESRLGWLTAAHCAYTDYEEDQDDAVAIGRSVGQYSYADLIGEITKHAYHRIDDDHLPGLNSQGKMDAAYVHPEDVLQPAAQHAKQGTDSFESAFHQNSTVIAEDQLKDLKYEANNVFYQGRRLGRCEQTIHSVSENTIWGVQRFEVYRPPEQYDAGGNSGAPMWAEVDGEMVGLGLHRASTTNVQGTYTVGVYLKRIEEQLNVAYLSNYQNV